MLRWATYIVLVIAVTSASAQERTQTGRPLSKEQIEKLEAGTKAIEEIEDLQKRMEVMIRARGIDCIKTFGHERFCKCLNEKLAVGLSFQEYVFVVTNTKDELKYSTLSGEQKQLVDNAIRVRDQCVTIVFTRQ